MGKAVLIYVQHLLGIGHLVRTSRIAGALDRAGLEVAVASGGVPVEGLAWPGTFTQLPPLAAGPAGFSQLVTRDGAALTEAGKDERRERLMACWRAAKPDAVIVEMFPFGRRQMAFELLPWLDAIRREAPRTLVVSSIRDILQNDTRADRRQLALDRVKAYFDLVLVHGDPAVARLDESFGPTTAIEHLIRYTGYIGPAPVADETKAPDYDVVVSVGGGAVGAPLVAAALAAKPATPVADRRWLVVTGPNMAPHERNQIVELANSVGAKVEVFHPALATLLQRAEVVISQAGYNTVAEILSGRARAVFVPFTAGGETEQNQRARLLAGDPTFAVVPPERADPVSLAAAVRAVWGAPARRAARQFDGATTSAALIKEALGLP